MKSLDSWRGSFRDTFFCGDGSARTRSWGSGPPPDTRASCTVVVCIVQSSSIDLCKVTTFSITSHHAHTHTHTHMHTQ